MISRKVIFGIIFIGAFMMRQWWIVLPMLGFALGYIARAEVERQRRGKRA